MKSISASLVVIFITSGTAFAAERHNYEHADYLLHKGLAMSASNIYCELEANSMCCCCPGMCDCGGCGNENNGA